MTDYFGFKFNTASNFDLAQAAKFGRPLFTDDSGVYLKAYQWKNNIYIVDLITKKDKPATGE